MINTNFTIIRFSDGVLTVQMMPPTPIGGQSFAFHIANHLGGDTSLITKSTGSGYGGGQSGITVADSGQGRMNIRMWASDTSGWEARNYATWCDRVDSGQVTPVTRGFLLLGL